MSQYAVYEADINLVVYESLLDLFQHVSDEISSVNPRDVIDLQSFVWVVSEYET